MRKTTIAGVALSAVLGCFYLACINYTEPNEVGIARNTFTGELWLQDKGGFHLTAPWTFVACVDTRPLRVCVPSAAHAAVNCKLVQFNPQYYREFVQVEGFRYYWWANRISFNWGYHEESRGVADIMRGYAFSVQQYQFITVLRTYEDGS